MGYEYTLSKTKYWSSATVCSLHFSLGSLNNSTKNQYLVRGQVIYTYQPEEPLHRKSAASCFLWGLSFVSAILSPDSRLYMEPFRCFNLVKTRSHDKVTRLDNPNFMTLTVKNLNNSVRGRKFLSHSRTYKC